MQLDSAEGQLFISEVQWLHNTFGSLNMCIKYLFNWKECIIFILYALLYIYIKA